PATGSDALKQAIADAQKAYNDGEAALKEQDWPAYGKAQEALQEALERAAAAQPKAGAEGDKAAAPEKDAGADAAKKPEKGEEAEQVADQGS
ncbi:hypothetical protein G3M55_72285, partial [Streptomyces sp. SID8455]|nr:hypothetical protein [Streptomyces sp. SID8455]